VILASELGELPRRLRILGEDLVAFRDGSGEIGLLELHCPHRGTSLEFGLVGEKGIRCCITAGSLAATARSSKPRASPPAAR
jgi:phenylpropionate dioxygenase-like ring-hydroxylating dioxygenase large terminal subunit